MLKLLRILLIFITSIFISLLSFFICFFNPFNPVLTWYMARFYSIPILFLLGADFEYEGVEKLSKYGPCVVVSNHQSNWDIFLIGRVVSKRLVSMGKTSIAYIPLFGQMYWMSGNILINRSNKKKAFQSMTNAARKIRETNLSVWIMAEGTRSRGRGLMPFKKGAFHTAYQSKSPIIPVVISSYYGAIDLNKRKSVRVKLKVLDPLYTNEEVDDPVLDLKERCYQAVKETLYHLDQEIIRQKEV